MKDILVMSEEFYNRLLDEIIDNSKKKYVPKLNIKPTIPNIHIGPFYENKV